MRHYKTWLFVVAALAALPVFACGAPAPTATSPTITASDRVGAHCRVTVTDSQGCEPGDVEALITPVRPRIEGCRRGSGGKLSIRVRQSAGKLVFDVAPGSSLDPTERECVLEALSTLNPDESATAWTGSSIRPSGFTSLITIEW